MKSLFVNAWQNFRCGITYFGKRILEVYGPRWLLAGASIFILAGLLSNSPAYWCILPVFLLYIVYTVLLALAYKGEHEMERLASLDDIPIDFWWQSDQENKAEG